MKYTYHVFVFMFTLQRLLSTYFAPYPKWSTLRKVCTLLKHNLFTVDVCNTDVKHPISIKINLEALSPVLFLYWTTWQCIKLHFQTGHTPIFFQLVMLKVFLQVYSRKIPSKYVNFQLYSYFSFLYSKKVGSKI